MTIDWIKFRRVGKYGLDRGRQDNVQGQWRTMVDAIGYDSEGKRIE